MTCKQPAANCTPAIGKPNAAAPADTDLRRKLTTTVVLVLFALVAIAMATFAWFSIADNAKTRMLMIDANADGSLRFDLDEHATFDEYVHSLGFDQISARIASDICVHEGIDTVALSGGVFMNRLLLQLLTRELKDAGLTVLIPQTVPVNDGCIAYGQAAVARTRLAQVAPQ